MVAAADDAHLRAKSFRSREIAPLKIGLTPCVSAGLIVRPLAEIARLMPGLRVDVVEHAADRLVEMLLDGAVNAAIVGRATAPSDRIDHWRLFEEALLGAGCRKRPAGLPFVDLSAGAARTSHGWNARAAKSSKSSGR